MTGEAGVLTAVVEVDTTTLFSVQPRLKRQSCHVTQTRPDVGSTSAAGNGKKRRPWALRTWTSDTVTGAPNVAPPSADTTEPMLCEPRRYDERGSSPVGRTTGSAPTASETGRATGVIPVRRSAPGRGEDVAAEVVRVREVAAAAEGLVDQAMRAIQFLSSVLPPLPVASVATIGTHSGRPPSLERLTVRGAWWAPRSRAWR